MSSPFTMTEAAASQISALLMIEPDKKALRIGVLGGGCSGFQYEFALVERGETDDIAITKNNATLYLDALALPYVQGAELDYVEGLMGSAFRIHNPNATASCGCGTSFSV